MTVSKNSELKKQIIIMIIIIMIIIIIIIIIVWTIKSSFEISNCKETDNAL